MNDDRMERISRYLARARELELDPANLEMDRTARLVGHLLVQRNMLAKTLDSLLDESHRFAEHHNGRTCQTCRDASVVLGEYQRLKKKYG